MAQQSTEMSTKELKSALRRNTAWITLFTGAMALHVFVVSAGWASSDGVFAGIGPVASGITFISLVFYILRRITLTAQLYAQKG